MKAFRWRLSLNPGIVFHQLRLVRGKSNRGGEKGDDRPTGSSQSDQLGLASIRSVLSTSPNTETIAHRSTLESVRATKKREDLRQVVGQEDRANRLLQLYPELNPAIQSRLDHLRSFVTQRLSAGDHLEDIAASMSDGDLMLAIRAGAFDPLLLNELDADEGLDQEGEIPNEFLQSNEASVSLLRQLVETCRGEITEDDALAIARAKSGDMSEVTQSDLASLERLETEEAQGYVDCTNAVLKLAAEADPKILSSLSVLDRTRRAAMADKPFQEAVVYSRKADKVALETHAAEPRTAKPDFVSNHFTDPRFSRPPPRADSGVPRAPKPTQHQLKGLRKKPKPIFSH
jgi:hypothetical protein